MIELLGVGIPRDDKGWLLHRVCASIGMHELTVVVSREREERLALLDALTGRRIAEEGRVWVSRVPVMRETRTRLRSLVAEVDLEQPFVERRSILWNTLALQPSGWRAVPGFLRLPRASERRAALRALARVGLETETSRAVADLDREARARVRLARELARQPEYLIVREIDATLGHAESSRLLNLIRSLVRGERMAAVVSIGSPSLARATADRIIGVADGLLVLDGPPSAIPDRAFAERMGMVAESV